MAEPAEGQAVGPGAEAGQEGCIATADRLEAFCSLPAAERPPLNPAMRGVLAETALAGLQRYEWRLLAPLLHNLVDAVLADFSRQEAEVEGPPRPPPPGFDSTEAVAARLHALLDGFEEAPFTLQRLCEVLLEPRKQYRGLEKVAVAIEKLLMVTSTRQPDTQLPPPPALATLVGVNSNPKSPYLDGRPPQVLDPQQHQALLQQQAQAMAAAQQQQQQHLRQQQQQQQEDRQAAGGLPNGLDDEGPPPLEAANGGEPEEGAAAAAAEAMQLEAEAFVESVMADSASNGGGGTGGREGSLQAMAAAGDGSAAPAASTMESGRHSPHDEGGPTQQQHEGLEGVGAAPPPQAGPAAMDVDGGGSGAVQHPPTAQQASAEAEQQSELAQRGQRVARWIEHAVAPGEAAATPAAGAAAASAAAEQPTAPPGPHGAAELQQQGHGRAVPAAVRLLQNAMGAPAGEQADVASGSPTAAAPEQQQVDGRDGPAVMRLPQNAMAPAAPEEATPTAEAAGVHEQQQQQRQDQ